MSNSDKHDYKKLTSGLLNKEQIKHALEHYGLLKEYDSQRLQSCSYDLRVGTIFKEGDMFENDIPVDIEPGEIVTIHTLENVKLPKDIAGTVFPINKESSKGFMVLNPGHIDPGYDGVLTVKAVNLTKNRLSIMRKDPIFTILFEKLSSETEGYKNRITQEEKKREQLRIERDISPHNIFQIPKYWKKDNVFAYTVADVKFEITTHWLGRFTIILAIIALMFSISTNTLSLCYSIASEKNSPQVVLPMAKTEYVGQKIEDSNVKLYNPSESNIPQKKQTKSIDYLQKKDINEPNKGLTLTTESNKPGKIEIKDANKK